MEISKNVSDSAEDLGVTPTVNVHKTCASTSLSLSLSLSKLMKDFFYRNHRTVSTLLNDMFVSVESGNYGFVQPTTESKGNVPLPQWIKMQANNFEVDLDASQFVRNNFYDPMVEASLVRLSPSHFPRPSSHYMTVSPLSLVRWRLSNSTTWP